MKKRILLLGNPNVGKSVIFRCLTGRYVTVSNYPGTTVATTSGRANFDRESVVVDSPGINSLIPRSGEERVARDLLLEDTETVVVQVADARSLRRTLLLAVQLAEAGVSFVLALNMADEAKERGIGIDEAKLSHALGVPVVSTVATQGKGISRLKEKIKQSCPASLYIKYDDVLEEAISSIECLLPPLPISRRSVAIMLLSGDPGLEKRLSHYLSSETIKAIREKSLKWRAYFAKPIAYIVNQRRIKEVEKLVAQVFIAKEGRRRPIQEFIGKISVHPLWGVPFLLLTLYLLYQVVGVFGAGTVVDFVVS